MLRFLDLVPEDRVDVDRRAALDGLALRDLFRPHRLVRVELTRSL